MEYKLWNRKTNINGCEPKHFLEGVLKGYDGDVILILNEGVITNVEMKDVLANIYEIDKTLPLDTFMQEYLKKIEEVE